MVGNAPSIEDKIS